MGASGFRSSRCPWNSCACLPRKREPEHRAAAGRGIDPDFPAMALDDALADRQPDAGARELAPRVQALENDEKLPAVFGRDPDAVVDDRETTLTRLPACFDSHPRRMLLAELDRVADQILKQLHKL